jgi:solute:Na+ symporter, SSS family
MPGGDGNIGMNNAVPLGALDYVVFAAYILALCAVGWWAGRRQADNNTGFFLADKSLPWYVIGSSYIAANISTEHFIALLGSAMIYGICMATGEWSSVIAFSFLIWLFIPFLLSAKVFTAPEFLEKRFTPTMRLFFASVTVIVNVLGFLAPMIYGGGLALERVFGINTALGLDPTAVSSGAVLNWGLYIAIIGIGIAAGAWAVWGGLKSVAWMDLLTVLVMVLGGLSVTYFGLKHLGGPSGSLIDGFKVMIERNQATTGVFKEAMERLRPEIVPGATTYNRLSVIQPLSHLVTPWIHWVLSFFYIGLWYTVINQFMVQRIFAARSKYDARMGIVLASYLKLLIPFIVVIPGLIYFAMHPEILLTGSSLNDVRPEADKTYVNLIRELLPVGMKGLLLAALFGALKSAVAAVLNATSMIVTLDLYKRFVRPDFEGHKSVVMGRWITVVLIVISILVGIYISSLKTSLFVYIQTLFNFFAPPFSAVFLLGTLWRRVSGNAATATVLIGFTFGIIVKIAVSYGYVPWLAPFAMQSALNWAFCIVLCSVLSLLLAPPRSEQVTDDLTFNWSRMNIGGDLGTHWWNNVTLWWGGSVVIMLFFIYVFGIML